MIRTFFIFIYYRKALYKRENFFSLVHRTIIWVNKWKLPAHYSKPNGGSRITCGHKFHRCYWKLNDSTILWVSGSLANVAISRWIVYTDNRIEHSASESFHSVVVVLSRWFPSSYFRFPILTLPFQYYFFALHGPNSSAFNANKSHMVFSRINRANLPCFRCLFAINSRFKESFELLYFQNECKYTYTYIRKWIYNTENLEIVLLSMQFALRFWLINIEKSK